MFSDADAFCITQVFLLNGKCSFFLLVIAPFFAGAVPMLRHPGHPRQTGRETDR